MLSFIIMHISRFSKISIFRWNFYEHNEESKTWCSVKIHCKKPFWGYSVHTAKEKTLRLPWFSTDLSFYYWIIMNQYWFTMALGSRERIQSHAFPMELFMESKDGLIIQLWISALGEHSVLINKCGLPRFVYLVKTGSKISLTPIWLIASFKYLHRSLFVIPPFETLVYNSK